MTALIVGCGDLGTEVGLRLVATGRDVLGLRRAASRLPPPLNGQAVDIRSQVPVLPTDSEIVVFTAAPEARRVAAYRACFVDGLANVLSGLDKAGARPRRVIFVSSTALFGVSDGSWVDETTPPAPASDTAAVLLEAERMLQYRAPEAVLLRLGGLYGPGRLRLVDSVRTGSAVIPNQPQYTNRIHRDDAAAAVVHLSTMTHEPAPVYLGVDHEPAERGEVLRFLAEELGVAEPPVGEAVPPQGGSKRCRGERLRGTGFRFTYPTYRDGYRAVLAGSGSRHP